MPQNQPSKMPFPLHLMVRVLSTVIEEAIAIKAGAIFRPWSFG